MEKMIKKMMVAGLACIAMCGSALAAPKHGNGPAPKGKAPMVQKAPRGYTAARPAAHKSAPRHQVAMAPAPRHHAMRPEHHMPPSRPTTPCHRHRRHDCHDCHYDHNGWVELGAGIIGGIIGALIAG